MNTNQAANLLTQIVDIKGLDTISWWPLAPIWWILLAIIALALMAWAVIYLRRRAYERSWKGDAQRTLTALESRLNDSSEHEVAGALSLTLRRIAMQRFSRRECAGLEGREWLVWLQNHDPRGFDWTTHGLLLTEVPYAPPNMTTPPEKIRALIEATRQWVT